MRKVLINYDRLTYLTSITFKSRMNEYVALRNHSVSYYRKIVAEYEKTIAQMIGEWKY